MSRAAVAVCGLRKRYGKVVALDGLDFEVAPGTVTGLLGPNGSGKTTTVNILSTALTPDGGEAEVAGHDVRREPAAVRASIGLAGQFAAVDENLSGSENLALIARLSRVPRREVSKRVDELLERFRLEESANRLVRTYSGGMRRRLDVAAALVHRPPVLFLDEPTTGLDPESRADLWQLIRELVRDGATLLLTTQYLEEADALADTIVVIGEGKVIAEGRPRDLKQQYGAAVVELRFAGETDASRAARLLATAGLEPGVEGSSISVAGAAGSAVAVDAIRCLDGIDPVGVDIRQPTLDDVFLALTGHAARSAQKGRGAK